MSRAAVRKTLGDALSPTRVEVKPAAVHTLLNALANSEIYADTGTTLADNSTDMEGQAFREAGEDAWLLTAATVFNGLSRQVNLPRSIPQESIQRLAAGLTSGQRAAVQALADELLAVWKPGERLFGQASPPRVEPEWMPTPRNVRSAVEAALTTGGELNIRYWGIGDETPLRRHIRPYWIEERKNVPYVVAYCHLREADESSDWIGSWKLNRSPDPARM